MGLDALLARLSGKADTPDTPCNLTGVSDKPAWIGACTLDTPDTPELINGEDVAAEPVAEMSGNPLASFWADSDVDRNPCNLPTVADSDDRRQCTQCQNLRGRACSIAKPQAGALVVANVGYRPQPDTLHRCAGYLPNATDNDQRPGGERWPGLTDTKGNQ